MSEQRERFEASASLTPAGEFEIVAMTAGVGNGWTFGEDALRASLALWDGVDMFVDHMGPLQHRSVRDLGGVAHSPSWDSERKGVRLKMRTCGPSGPLVAALGREMLAEGGSKPHVGLSADVGFTATGRDVATILRVFSLDVVFDPARGGAFLRALNSIEAARSGREGEMSEEKQAAPVAAVASELDAVRTLLDVQKEQAVAAEEIEKSRQVRIDMCAYLLESGLMASKLPAAAQAAVRKQFTGRAFEASELTAAIEESRKLVAELTGGANVAGLLAVHGVFSGEDQLQAAVYDLFDAPRDAGTENLKVHALMGVRELYHGMTGDFDFHGALYPDRAQFQHTTATFTGLVKNAMNKALIERWRQLGRAGYDWWTKICRVEHFSTLNQITWDIFGTVQSLPTVAEGAEYAELHIGDSPEVSDFVKYGGYIGLTLEALDRDETRKLKAIPRELASAALRNISAQVAAIFTANAGVGPTLADTGALFNSTAVATKGGHLNLLTVALAAAQWDVVQTAVYNQPMLVDAAAGYYGAGKPLAVNPRYILVPRALQLTARAIKEPAWSATSNAHTENLQQGEKGDVITVPEWTDANDWAAVCDPAVVPGICIGERFGIMPEIFVAGDEASPAVFSNDESRIKVRHFVAVGVADFRPLHKSNVA